MKCLRTAITFACATRDWSWSGCAVKVSWSGTILTRCWTAPFSASCPASIRATASSPPSLNGRRARLIRATSNQQLANERLRSADQQVDLGAGDARGVGFRCLCDHLVCCLTGNTHPRHGAHLQAAPAQVQFRGAKTLADNVGNHHALRPKALRQAHAPAAADFGSCLRPLRQNAPHRHVSAVEALFDFDQQSVLKRRALRLLRGKPNQPRDRDLAAVDGHPHCGECCNHGYRQQDERKQRQTKETAHDGWKPAAILPRAHPPENVPRRTFARGICKAMFPICSKMGKSLRRVGWRPPLRRAHAGQRPPWLGRGEEVFFVSPLQRDLHEVNPDGESRLSTGLLVA